MTTTILNTNSLGEVIKRHIEENNLRPLIMISAVQDNTTNTVDVFSEGAYPSQTLIRIMKQVTERLIEERREYLEE